MSEQILPVFTAQQRHKTVLRNATATDRVQRLQKLRIAIESREEKIFAALQNDLRKSRFESALAEIYFVYAEIDHAIKNIATWMAPRKVGRTLSNGLADSYIHMEPKGNTLILSPWNYPFQLAAGPLVSAIAAGNTAILKPSEHSAETSACLTELISETFAPEEIFCVQGDADTAIALLQLPFDHIFFTGSTAVGKKIMAAAAEHLSSVTLELGGKSPCVISGSANLEKAARKIAWGKLVNSGQTCIAPDHVYVHESQLERFITAYREAARALFFLDEEQINAGSYARMINHNHFNRQQELLDDALAQGAMLAWGGNSHAASLTFFPALLTGVPDHSRLMQEEVFGPLLPVLTYKSMDEAAAAINSRPAPLALYFFGQNKSETAVFLKTCPSGGACVNDVLVHISNPALPFGGRGPSGMGSSHGLAGFRAFSHERSVMYQSVFNTTRFAYPPYARKTGLLNWLKKIM
ncbi:aldehyde dehydrogenase family protein [Pedobacter yulinensis]|uniref:Aldehyde dehydrogenase n=1 Tax=Pedobacter yulinensis TaxID=2126353 RepID=A0A2T3HSB2_9SPHI|nr:aldehyde dehydrogenase family protein [Pedobacter yulinensis]PST85303.1 aldehyde dehydrogenase family protein [Pedobacter yulinensis]